MEARSLGRSGLIVGRLALGTMTWGRETDQFDAREQLLEFVDAGGTLVDTADVYADGASETLLGSLLNSAVSRSDLVIATKAVSRPGTARRFDASRRHLLDSLDQSLLRLKVDVIDLWQMHAWDPLTPLDETLSAIDEAVRSGRVRYAGVSNYSGWQLTRAAGASSTMRLPLISAQMEYSLVERGIEREVVPAAVDAGIGLLPWSPLGRGVLTGKYRHGIPADSRAASGPFSGFVSAHLGDQQRHIVDAVCIAADGLGVPAACVALSWVRDRPGVTAPVLGARTVAQLRQALASDTLTLPEQIRDALDDVSAIPRGYPDHGWNQRGS
jgi:aryl-alcohol dehydrogenase-like predicted oxidoreductase